MSSKYKCCICGASSSRYVAPNAPNVFYCGEHKTREMYDSRVPRCEVQGCANSRRYGFVDESARFCAQHKLRGMIDIARPRCEHPGCIRYSTYNFAGMNAQFCRKHSAQGMINVRRHYCIVDGCDKEATMRAIGDQYRMHCTDHSRELFGEKLWEFSKMMKCKSCNRVLVRELFCAANRVSDNFPQYCASCAPDNARMVVARKHDGSPMVCAKCDCVAIVGAFNGLCSLCEFGERSAPIIRKRREDAMMRALCNIGLDRELIRDSVPEAARANGVLSRPDFMWRRDGYIVILEVDECQHGRAIGSFERDAKPFTIGNFTLTMPARGGDTTIVRRGYTRDHELTRMVVLRAIFGVPTMFIRFNPDSFIDDAGIRRNLRGDEYARIARFIARADLRAIMERDFVIAFARYDGQCDNTIDLVFVDLAEQSLHRGSIAI